MDGARFDDLSRLLAGAASRRAGLKAALGGLLALPAGRSAAAQEQAPDEGSAFPLEIAKRRKKKACRPGCVDGYSCVKGACRCRSGILCAGVCCVAGSACTAEGVCSLGPEPGCWQPETTFGSGPGPGTGQLHYPYGIAVTSDGLTAYVSDSGNNRIAIWARPTADSDAWEQTGAFGSTGTGPGQFRHPLGSALTGDGLTLFVADLDNKRVAVWTRPHAGSQAWTPQATFGRKGRLPDEFRQPVTVAAARDGLAVWVTDAVNRRVALWTRPDAASTAWAPQALIGEAGSATPFEVPVGAWVSPDAETLLVSDGVANHVTMWRAPETAGGAWTRVATFGTTGWGEGQFRTPWGVTGSADALTAWVSDGENDRLSIWARPDEASTAWTWQANVGSGPGADPGQFYAPLATALPFSLEDAPREVLVADTGNSRISVWRHRCLAG